MSESRIVKGQAWIQGDKLVQEQILITPGSVSSTNVVALIENIWEDLIGTGTYKTNGRGYFYWEYKMTDTEDDNVEMVVKFECPKPKEGLFQEPYDPSKCSGEYSKYWVGRLKTAVDNFELKSTVQRKEVIFPGTTYVDSKGDVVELEDTKFSNNDLGDITNLLNIF